MIVLGAILDLLPLLSDFLNAPEIQTVITSVAGPYGTHFLKGIGVLTVAARLRSLKTGA